MENIIKTLEYYKRLPYTMYAEPIRDSDGSNYWTAEYTELRGCKTDGLTEGEAVLNLYELFDEYISALIEKNTAIPEPQPIPDTVGRIWIIVPEEQLSFVAGEFDTETERTETKDTSSEVKSEISSHHYEEMAA